MTYREAWDVSNLIDILSGHKYSAHAFCPKDGNGIYLVHLASPLGEPLTLRTYDIAIRWMRRQFTRHPLLKRE